MRINNSLGFFGSFAEVKEIKRLFKINYFEINENWLDHIEYGDYDISIQNYIDEFNDTNIVKVISETLPNMPYVLNISTDESDYINFLYLGSKDYEEIDNYELLRDLGIYSSNEKEKSYLKIKEENYTKFKPSTPLIVGEFKKIVKNQIIKKSNGVFHEVVLYEDNNIGGRGSNANGQLDFNIVGEIVDFECGRFFTAFLKKDGKVDIFGELGSIYKYQDIPYEVVVEDKNILKRNIKKDISVKVEMKKINGRQRYLIYDKNDKCLGKIKYNSKFHVSILAHELMFYNLVVFDFYTYNESRLRGGKPFLKLCLKAKYIDYLKEIKIVYKKVDDWENIIKIKANYSGLFGYDNKGNIFVDGLVNIQ